MFRRWFVAAVLLVVWRPGSPLFADGVAAGVVLDGRTGMPLRGATVSLEGTTTSATTDLNGVYQLVASAGTYTAIVMAAGYEGQKLTGVVIEDSGTVNLSTVLDPSGAGAGGLAAADSPRTLLAEEITVTAEAVVATEIALLAERRAAAPIIDNIGSEEMSKNTGSDAAGALKRVTGISLQDNKYVYVRGLGDRYSNTQLNGNKLPTTEFERKVVPLDLFPADMLEKVTVAKSYTADQPADFVAGVVQLDTRAFPARQQFAIGAGTGYNTETTGEAGLEHPRGLSASGGGGQPLPGSIPAERLVRFSSITGQGFTPAELEAFGEQLIGDWTPVSSEPPRNRDFQFSYGGSFGRAGLVLAGSWSDDFERRLELRSFYSGIGEGLEATSDFDFVYGTDQVRSTLLAGFGLRVGQNGQLVLRGLRTGLSEAESRRQTGFLSDINNEIIDQRLRYQDQAVDTYQLGGDFFFSGIGNAGSLLEFRVASSEAETEENLRQSSYEESRGQFVFSNSGQAGFLYYHDLADEVADGRLDWTTSYSRDRGYGSIKFGVAGTDSERNFASRRFRYFARGLRGIDLTAPYEEIISPPNIQPSLFEIREISNPTDVYQGQQDVQAAYAQADLSRGKWRLIAGMRYEDNQQDVVTFDRRDVGRAPVVTAIDQSDVLPSLSAVYGWSDTMSLRASLSRTLNRPEFRELAPYQFTSIAGGFNVIGNPELQQATVDSVDLRWEWYPSPSELVAVSVFHKRFDDPIEDVVLSGAEPTQTFANAEQAGNQGVEVEVRRSLGSLARALETVTLIANYAFIDSEIEIDPESTAATNPTRPLVGQPDNVGNLVLEWAPRRGDTTLRLLYNWSDDRIAFAGGLGLPDVLEESRGTLDLVLRQGLWRGLTLKVSAQNLLDEERRWTQGGEVFRRYETGRGFDLSLGYSF